MHHTLISMIMLAALVSAQAEKGAGQERVGSPVVDVFAVMDKADELGSLPLWPGFEGKAIPVAVYAVLIDCLISAAMFAARRSCS